VEAAWRRYKGGAKNAIVKVTINGCLVVVATLRPVKHSTCFSSA